MLTLTNCPSASSCSQTPDTPFYMYVSFNHIHNPNFASLDFCGSSGRGPVGDAAQEMDHAVGRIMEAVRCTLALVSLLEFVASPTPIATFDTKFACAFKN